jgi:N-acylneuraminate cytidylyltransferase
MNTLITTDELLRTQDLEPLYEKILILYIHKESLQILVVKKNIVVSFLMFEIDKIEAVDIDEPQDCIIAESHLLS